ncbi:hypothetical protein GCM10009613_51750 [Pseudonocardia kongjuensis]|uniref:CobQ/CobB/MinD/ParA nucleotide binding domain-containing protein n=1 Tax=Pseudonocardia kongjuensis TaxID=102227 RepID=A0ABP4ISV4_9PSEU
MSENGSGEQPDGSVGRYVRERWGAAESSGRSFGRRRRTSGDDAAQPEGGAAQPAASQPRPPSAAERAASAPAPGRAAVGTQTPPAGSVWGSELPEIDDDLVDEIDPSTPPHGLDLSALHERSDAERERPAGPGPAAEARADDGRHRAPEDLYPTGQDVGPDDTGLYRSGGAADPEPWWTVPGRGGHDDEPGGELIWRRPDPPSDEEQTHADDADVTATDAHAVVSPSWGGPGAGTAGAQDRDVPDPSPDGAGADRDRPVRPGGTVDDRPDGSGDAAGPAHGAVPVGGAPGGGVRDDGAGDGGPPGAGGPGGGAASGGAAGPGGAAAGAAVAGDGTAGGGAGSGGSAAPAGGAPAPGGTPGPGGTPAPGGTTTSGGPTSGGTAVGGTAAGGTAVGGATAAGGPTAVGGATAVGGGTAAGDATAGAAAARGTGQATGRPAADRPWRSSWDRDAAEREASDRARRDNGSRTGGARPAPESGSRRPRWTAPEAVEARHGQHRRSDGAHGGLDLTPHRSGSPRRPPESGWRRFVYLLTGGLVNPGESPAELHRRDLVSRLNRPLLNAHKIAMLSLKGGVGKTTVTATLGATFASHRGDRVVAVDANPDRGTLSQKIPLETTATVRHLLRDSDRVRRYTDVRSYTSQGQSRLEVLASEQDPAVSEAFSEDDYRRAVDLLEHFYNLVLTDCGTGLMHSAMYGVLGMADQLVIVSSGSIDGARSASATLDWLDAHGYGNLVRNAVVVINSVYRRAGGGVDLDRVAEHFAGRCRAVVRVPFDPHLEEGAEIDLDRLEEPTRTALLELAAAVADGFPV